MNQRSGSLRFLATAYPSLAKEPCKWTADTLTARQLHVSSHFAHVCNSGLSEPLSGWFKYSRELRGMARAKNYLPSTPQPPTMYCACAPGSPPFPHRAAPKLSCKGGKSKIRPRKVKVKLPNHAAQSLSSWTRACTTAHSRYPCSITHY